MDRYGALTLLGLGLAAAGLYLIYAPLALLVPGVVLFALGLIAGRGAK